MNNITFVTPYLTGERMLEIHLASIRKFYPEAEIIITAVDDSAKALADKYNVDYRVDNKDYVRAVEATWGTGKNNITILCDHDTVLLGNIDHLIEKVSSGEVDIVGVEERIRHPHKDMWERYAPGYTDLTFFIFSKQNMMAKVDTFPKYPKYNCDDPNNINHEFHYKICKLMPRHFYLLPYHVDKYGLGNLLRDGDKDILWHQWFGSWEKREGLVSEKPRDDKSYESMQDLINAEKRFLDDYPNLDFNQVRLINGDN